MVLTGVSGTALLPVLNTILLKMSGIRKDQQDMMWFFIKGACLNWNI
jgi:hypothetical protein